MASELELFVRKAFTAGRDRAATSKEIETALQHERAHEILNSIDRTLDKVIELIERPAAPRYAPTPEELRLLRMASDLEFADIAASVGPSLIAAVNLGKMALVLKFVQLKLGGSMPECDRFIEAVSSLLKSASLFEAKAKLAAHTLEETNRTIDVALIEVEMANSLDSLGEASDE